MDREALIERLADHARRPRHAGPLPDAHVSAGAGNPGCGDVVTVHLRLAPDDRVEAATFEGTGCTISQGAASLLLQHVNHARPTLAELQTLTLERHLDRVGREIVGFRERCAAVALDAVRRAARALEAERKLIAAGYAPDEARRMRRQAYGS